MAAMQGPDAVASRPNTGAFSLMAQAAQARQAFHDREFNAVPWWEKGIIYQIYPRSFQDSDGDGIGDLPGITSRLDYLQWLGVDAIWISPIYPSPMADFGYDVSDYTRDPPGLRHAGGLRPPARRGPPARHEGHPRLRAQPHLGPAPVVPGEPLQRDNPKRDWYIWRDPKPDGGPPNNWLSVFGGRAWEFDEKTGQYYYHAFLKEQPDLNWRNPEVRQAMFDVLRFWLERGRGRLPRRRALAHDQGRPVPRQPAATRTGCPPKVPTTRCCRSTRPTGRRSTISPPRCAACSTSTASRVLIGEIYLPIERLVTYYGANGDGVHLPFNFQLITPAVAGRASIRPTRRCLRGCLARWRLAQLGAGQPRQAPRRQPRRARAGPRGGHAAADPARHAHDVLRRRDRHAGRAHPAGQGAGPLREERAGPGPGPRPRPHAHAVGHHATMAGFCNGDALAAAERLLPAAQRRDRARQPALDALALPHV